MQTRRDRLQAYRFGTRRSVATLLDGDPDAPEAPLRRVTGAVFAGILIAALVVAAAAVYGVLNPGGAKTWRDGTELIVEKETDTRYVYTGGVLHPVLNYASARLLLNQPELKVATVSRASLGTTPRGLAVGIPSAPDALPAASALVGVPWTVCAEPARTPAGAAVAFTSLALAAAGSGSRPVPDDGALLVSGPDGTRYLVWHGYRFAIGGNVVLSALGWSANQVLTVGAAWLNALSAGPDLVPPSIPGRGGPAPTGSGAAGLVGQVFQVSNVDTQNQFYVMRPDGLSAVTPFAAALLLGDPASQRAYPSGAVAPEQISAAVAAATAHSATAGDAPAQWPSRVPALVDTSGGAIRVCATDADPTGTAAAVSLSTQPDQPSTVDSTAVDPVTRSALADSVRVPPTRGAVVRALSGPDVAGGTVYLVTDLGCKYPVTAADLLPGLGYQGVTPVPVPVGILSALPTGPALDRAAAANTVSPLPAGAVDTGP